MRPPPRSDSLACAPYRISLHGVQRGMRHKLRGEWLSLLQNSHLHLASHKLPPWERERPIRQSLKDAIPGPFIQVNQPIR